MAKLLSGTRIYGTANVDTQINVGANAVVNTSAYFIGNSTVNTTITASGFVSQGTIAAGNTTITGWANVSGNVTASNIRTLGGVQIDGDLTVSGNTITIGVTNLAVSDNIIYLNEPETVTITSATSNGTAYIYTANNGYNIGQVVTVTGMTPSGYNIVANTITFANTTTFAVANTSAPGSYVSGGTAVARVDANPDVGFAANYNDGTYRHAGFFRDATDGVFKVFDQYVPEPAGAFIDTANNTFRIAGFQANATTLGTLTTGNTTITGFINVSSTATVNGALTVNNTASIGNTTIIGFANVTGTANIAGNTQFSANVWVASNLGIGNNTSNYKLMVEGGAPWFKPNITGANTTALYLGRMSDQDQPAYAIRTDDATDDSLTFMSTRYNGYYYFKRNSGSGEVYAASLLGQNGVGTSFTINHTETDNTVKISLNTGGDSYINTAANVGIGTTAPNAKLQVVGTANISGVTTISSNVNVVGANINFTGTSSLGTFLRFAANTPGTHGLDKPSSNSSVSQRFDFFNAGSNNASNPFWGGYHFSAPDGAFSNSTAGTGFPRVSLYHSYTSTTNPTDLYFNIVTGNGPAGVGHGVRVAAYGADGVNRGIDIAANGNIGIGNTAPADKLSVFGTVAVTNSTANVINIAANGNIGIGYNSPNFKLRVAGTIVGDANDNYFGTMSGDYVDIGNLGATGSVYFDARGASSNVNIQIRAKGSADHVFLNQGGSTEVVRFAANGNVGIGTASPSVALTVSAANVNNSISTAAFTNPNTGTGSQSVMIWGAGASQSQAIQGQSYFEFKTMSMVPQLYFSTTNAASGSIIFRPGNATTALYLAANGNVGVGGNTTPTDMLRVEGTFSALTSASVGANVIANTTSLFVGNSTVNTVITANSFIINDAAGGVANVSNSGIEFIIQDAGTGFSVVRSSAGGSQRIRMSTNSGGHFVNAIATNANPKPLRVNVTSTGNTTYDTFFSVAIESTDKLKANSSQITTFANAYITGDATITGNLTVTGTTTYINTTTLNVGDNIITLNADVPSGTAPTENMGFEFNRGSSANVSILWDETNGQFKFTGQTAATGTILTITNSYGESNKDLVFAYNDSTQVGRIRVYGRPGTPGGAQSMSFWLDDGSASPGANLQLRMNLAANGNFGIGNSAPADRLSVNGTVQFTNSTASVLYAAANGNIGVGTTTPFAPVNIYTNVNGNNPTAVIQNLSTGSSAQAMLSIRGDTSTTQLDIGVSSNTYGGYGLAVANGAYILSKSVNGLGIFADNAASYIRFGAGGTSEGMRLNANGGLYVGTTGDLYGRQWQGIYNKNQNATTQVGVINSNTGASAEARFSLITGTGNSYVDWGLIDAAGVPTSTMGYGSAVGIFKITLTNTNGSFKVGNTTSTALHVSTSNGNVGIGNSTPTDKLRVEGTISHLGLSPSTGTGIDQIYTATPSITLNTTWQSTGVTSTSLANGSYMVQLFANDVAAGGTANNEYYTGMMSWYSADTNSTILDEIPLHRAGVNGSNNSIFLATQRTATANTSDLILMISSAANNSSSSTYTLKFRRMI